MSFSDEGKENDGIAVIAAGHDFKKRLIFIRHGNSIWNKMKAGGTKSKISALGQGVLEFAKTSYYDTASHKTSTVMDAPLSDIGITQCKDLYTFLPTKCNQLQKDLLSATNYLNAYKKCNQYITQSSSLINNILLPINNNRNENNDESQADLYAIQDLLNKSKLEIANSISEFNNNKVMADVAELERLLSIICVLTTSSNDSVIVCSNLRRAISTSIIALWHRFEANKNENLYMLHCLQELGYGVDCISHNDTGKVAKESHLNNFVKGFNNLVTTGSLQQQSDTAQSDEMEKIPLSQFEEECAELNMLNHRKSYINSQKMRLFYAKRLKTMDVNTKLAQMSASRLKIKNKQENRKESDKKIELFMDWVFNDKQNENIHTFVVIGHSNWMKAFFNKYLDGVYHDFKRSKIKNCGVVSLDIYRNYRFKKNKVNQYTIMAETITSIYEGSL